MFVTGLTLPQATALCNALDKLTGIPDPSLFPGTVKWADPRPMQDGTYAVPVPRKGSLKEALAAFDRDAVKAAAILTTDETDMNGKKTKDKRFTVAALKNLRDALATARAVDQSEWPDPVVSK